ncbi:MAG: undecaprenyl-phosphate glucose phosphotransferase, partial [bacterium]|nr:undecaprenyl-phosphate glucose phosphotransferase [bacterium]
LAENIASRMRLHPEYGIELLGCLQADPPLRDRGLRSLPGPELVYPDYGRPAYPWGSAMGHVGRSGGVQGNTRLKMQVDNLDAVEKEKIIGFYSDLPDILQNYNIDQVIIAVPLADHDKLESIVASIGDEMVDVRIVPDIHRFIQLGSEIEEFDGLPVVSLASTPLVGVNRLLKRCFDIFFGAVFTLLALPMMAFTALMIKLTSRGPVLFVQERVGLDGRKFPIYKFRTMKVDAESSGARFAVRNDPRTTAIGAILRKLSLDELPQLFNVMMGHMSLVGPRPERPVFIEEFRQRVPKYMLRHKVQAGMTGWAQVNGWRGNTSIERRIEHDLYYIEHWSLLLDLRIILLTLICGLWNKNAY